MEPLYIEVVGSSGAPAELPRQGKLVIGSSSEKASFVVPGQGVAGVHCAIGRIKGGGWALRDLGSEFGTLLNGAPVEATRLSEGDEILLGSKKLRHLLARLGQGGRLPEALPAPQAANRSPRSRSPRTRSSPWKRSRNSSFRSPPPRRRLPQLSLPQPRGPAPRPRPRSRGRPPSRALPRSRVIRWTACSDAVPWATSI